MSGEVPLRRLILCLVSSAILVIAGAAAAAVSHTADWQAAALVALLLVFAVASDIVFLEVRGLRLSGAFLALVLAMALLGPAPAAALGAASSLIDALVSRRSLDRAFVNTATFTLFPLLGGLTIDVVVGPDLDGIDGFGFAAIVLLVFMATNVVNFVMIAIATAVGYGVPLREMVRSFVTALPSEFATALLTAGIAFTYSETGVGAVGLAAVVIF